MLKKTDEELMVLYQTGEVAAFSELYRRYAGRLYGFLSRDPVTADWRDDAFQLTWLKVHRAREKFSSEKKFSSWLFAICHNTKIDFMRSEKYRSTETVFDETTYLAHPSQADAHFSERLHLVLAQLEPKEQMLLKARFEDEKSLNASLRKRLSRTISKLRTMLTKV